MLPYQNELCHLRKLSCLHKSSAARLLEPSWLITSLALHFLGPQRSEGASAIWDEGTKAGEEGSEGVSLLLSEGAGEGRHHSPRRAQGSLEEALRAMSLPSRPDIKLQAGLQRSR